MEVICHGKVVLIDSGDFELFTGFKWFPIKTNHRGRTYYLTNGKTYFHRLVMGLEKGNKLQVDHKNGNGLDNRKDNLRVATQTQNMGNQHINPHKTRAGKPVTSKYKGVSYRKDRNTYRASIGFQGKNIKLGSFADEMQAALAYNKAAKKYFGEFARLNTIQQLQVQGR